jgi:hypothetical protein
MAARVPAVLSPEVAAAGGAGAAGKGGDVAAEVVRGAYRPPSPIIYS